MTAPTEAEIRAAAERVCSGPAFAEQAIHGYSEFASATSEALWDPGDNWEATYKGAGLRQDRLVDDELTRVGATFEAAIVEAIVAALGRFATEYPDVPRAVREPVSA
jgi:uncharacterized YccA/Bax inhibitor family protein